MWWFLSVAWAAPGLVLPGGEDAAEWVDAAALAGVELGCIEGEPCVLVVATPTTWTLTTAGGTRTATLPAPRVPADRAEVAWLAASLATPLLPRSAAPSPAPAPPPRVVAAPRPAAPPPVAPQPVAPEVPAPPPGDATVPADAAALPGAAVPLAAAAPPPVVPPAAPPPLDLDSPAAPAAAAPSRQVYGRAAIGVAGSPGLGAAPAVELAGGYLLDHAWLEFAAGFGGAAPLLSLDRAYTERRVDLYVAGLPRPVAWFGAGPAIGVSSRAWAEDGARAGAAWTPTLALNLRLAADAGPLVTCLDLRAGWDARAVAVAVDGHAEGRLSPWWARLTVGGMVSPPRAKAPRSAP